MTFQCVRLMHVRADVQANFGQHTVFLELPWEMPRQDRTFRGTDIIRFIDRNLNSKERVEVLLSICKGVKIEVFDDKAILVPILAAEEAIEDVEIEKLIAKLLKLLFP